MSPAEPPEVTIARLEAYAELAMWSCPHCTVKREVLSIAPGSSIPRAVGITHEPGCPDGTTD